MRLPHGTLDIEGGHASVDTFSVPVTGGTGDYRGARGSATFRNASHDRERVVITLLG